MKRIYLHIGAHKTGTTAIQYFLWNNRKRLRKQSILYPKLGMGGYCHGVLANVIKPNNQDSRLAEYRERFRQEVLDSHFDTIILSSEAFLEGLNVAAGVRDFLPEDRCEVKIIVYLRNQADWLESVFNEIVRDPYRRYTGDIPNMREYEQGLHDYEKLLAPWIEQFGGETIELCPYEKARADGGVLEHLLQLLGIKDYDSFDFSIDPQHQNLRLHSLASEFLRRVNRFPFLNDEYLQVVDELQRVSSLVGEKFGKKFRVLSPKTVRDLRNEFAYRNSDLFERYSRYGSEALFTDSEREDEVPDALKSFDQDVQHAIFEALSPHAQSLLETIPKVRNRKAGERFLPPPPADQEKRLNEIIFRQRSELRRLYQKHGYKG